MGFYTGTPKNLAKKWGFKLVYLKIGQKRGFTLLDLKMWQIKGSFTLEHLKL